ncbi:uncharacterized protein I303_101043 [Kwoniella dejecticola CBS 10117]|uniref:FAD/NAD(P)-binding domain-containing protein n=1 Tax=Kwoniella dejecticola CBS 10117 TaxID=1296121 RepID=A0AAJ8KIX3_9TREE
MTTALTSTPEAYQNIVIIGASIAGHETANHLVPNLPGTYRILLIDARGFAWWPITILRAVVVPGWEDKVSIPLTTERVFKKGSPHQVIAPNKVLQLKADSVILEKPFEGSTEIPFFRCVIATGASQELPTMPAWDDSEDQFVESLRRSQRDIERATKVVVIGGGAVGVEIAGEIASHHPNKKMTLIHKDYGLLQPTVPLAKSEPLKTISEKVIHSYSSPPTDPRLSLELQRICDELGIEVILSDRVIMPSSSPTTPISELSESQSELASELGSTSASALQKGKVAWDGSFGLQPQIVHLTLESGKTVEADYVYPGCGMRPNSQIVKNVDPGALDGGLIRVDKHLKVQSTSPDSIFASQVYAIGDVCSCPGLKIAHGALWGAQKTATNIMNEIKGKVLSEYSLGWLSGLSLPMGMNEGAGMITFGWLGTWVFGSKWTVRMRGKTSGTERHFVGRFKGEQEFEIKFDF